MNEYLSDTQGTLQQHLQDLVKFVKENRQNFEKQTKDLIEKKPLYLSLIELYQEEIVDYERSCEMMMEEITERGERRLDYLEDEEERTACRSYMEEMKDKLDSMKHFRLNFLQNQLRLCRNTLCNIERRIEQNRCILSDPRSLDVAVLDGIFNVEFLQEVDLQLSVWISGTSFFPADFNASFPEKFGELTSQKYVQFPVEKLRNKLPKEESPAILSKVILSSTMFVIWKLIPYILATLLLMFIYCAFTYVFGVEIVFI